jgi:hypothetical protein
MCLQLPTSARWVGWPVTWPTAAPATVVRPASPMRPGLESGVRGLHTRVPLDATTHPAATGVGDQVGRLLGAAARV